MRNIYYSFGVEEGALENKTTFQQELDQGIASRLKSWWLTNPHWIKLAVFCGQKFK